MGGCSAPNCTNSTKKGFRLFVFPRIPERRAKWLQMCQRDKWKPTLNSCFCEVHFEDSQFEPSRADGWKKLKPNAVPTIFNVPNCPKRLAPIPRILQRSKSAEDSCVLDLNSECDANSQATNTEQVSCAMDLNSEGNAYSQADTTEQEEELIRKIKMLERRLLTTQKDLQKARSQLRQLRNDVSSIPSMKPAQLDILKPKQLKSGSGDGPRQRIPASARSPEIQEATPCPEMQHTAHQRNFLPIIPNSSQCSENQDDCGVWLVDVYSSDMREEDPFGDCPVEDPLAVEMEELEDPINKCNSEERESTDLAANRDPDAVDASHSDDGEVSIDLDYSSLKEEIVEIDNEEGDSTDACNHQNSVNPVSKKEDEYRTEGGDVPTISVWVDAGKPGVSRASGKRTECEKVTAGDPVEKILHKLHSDENRKFICTYCGVGFNLAGDFTSHKLLHENELPFKCNECKKGFYKKSNLIVHLRVHTGDKPFKCPTCDKCFSQKSGLNLHSRIHTGDKPFKCPMCDKSFSQWSNLNVHSRTHSGDKPFKCPTCNKCFSQMSGLNHHSRIHTGDKPFKCPTCDKSFSQWSNLNVHSRVHTGDKPFKCPMCDKNFSQRSSLLAHSRIHTGDMPFKCLVCNKNFRHLSTFNEHSRVHAGKKSFKCPTCDKSFTYRSCLNAHSRSHTCDK